jgi:hypothetical protein
MLISNDKIYFNKKQNLIYDMTNLNLNQIFFNNILYLSKKIKNYTEQKFSNV